MVSGKNMLYCLYICSYSCSGKRPNSHIAPGKKRVICKEHVFTAYTYICYSAASAIVAEFRFHIDYLCC